MKNNNKKIIILDNEVDGNKKFQNICYVNFLDDNKSIATFFEPLIAPKYLKEYIFQNKIEKAYEITNYQDVLDNKDFLYTFKYNKGVYEVEKGLVLDKKLLMFSHCVMNATLHLPKYSYSIQAGVIITEPYKKCKDYCYIVNEDDVNDKLKGLMIPVYEMIDGVFFITDNPFKENVKKMIKK